MFQPRQTGAGYGGAGLLFAPMRPPIQHGEGFGSSVISAISSMFRKSQPFLKSAFRNSKTMLRKVAASDVVDSIKKGVGNAAVDITSNLVADLVAGKTGAEATAAASEKLSNARSSISELIRNPTFESTRKKRKGKRKAKKNTNDSDDEFEPPPSGKKARKKTVTKTIKRRRNQKGYSVFDEG